jgi:hypothetical protein
LTLTVSSEDLPSAYCNEPHPIIPIDAHCTLCPLGKVRNARNAAQALEDKPEYSLVVPGAGPDDLSQVRLIVISDFAGHYEASNGQPFFDTHKHMGATYKKGLVRPYNAGGYLRMMLGRMYGLDTYNDCWLTNALKCDPGKRKPLINVHVKPCALRWLRLELQHLDEVAPQVPILVAGGTAFESMKLLYKDQAQTLDNFKLNGCRRRTDIRLGKHPAVFTLNPARPARCAPRLETEVRYSKGQYVVRKNEWINPELYLPGSPGYSFVQDLLILREFL